MRAKLIFAAVVLIGAVSYLAFAGARSGWVYFIDVDRYLAEQQFHARRVRLHGKVADDGFAAASAQLTAEFRLAGKRGTLPVVYRGSIPDMFQPGREVVVEGKRDAAGVFQADVLMTKCASKYEADSPHGKDHAAREELAAAVGR